MEQLTNFIVDKELNRLCILKWSWWDSRASDIHNWLNDNTELGSAACTGIFIYFKHPAELTMFLLKWSNK